MVCLYGVPVCLYGVCVCVYVVCLCVFECGVFGVLDIRGVHVGVHLLTLNIAFMCWREKGDSKPQYRFGTLPSTSHHRVYAQNILGTLELSGIWNRTMSVSYYSHTICASCSIVACFCSMILVVVMSIPHLNGSLVW